MDTEKKTFETPTRLKTNDRNLTYHRYVLSKIDFVGPTKTHMNLQENEIFRDGDIFRLGTFSQPKSVQTRLEHHSDTDSFILINVQQTAKC